MKVVYWKYLVKITLNSETFTELQVKPGIKEHWLSLANIPVVLEFMTKEMSDKYLFIMSSA